MSMIKYNFFLIKISVKTKNNHRGNSTEMFKIANRITRLFTGHAGSTATFVLLQ